MGLLVAVSQRADECDLRFDSSNAISGDCNGLVCVIARKSRHCERIKLKPPQKLACRPLGLRNHKSARLFRRLCQGSNAQTCGLKPPADIRPSLPHRDRSKPCAGRRIPCKDRSVPCKVCSFPYKENSSPCMENHFPCKVCSGPCMENCFPFKENHFPCKENRFPCKDCSFPCKENSFPRKFGVPIRASDHVLMDIVRTPNHKSTLLFR